MKGIFKHSLLLFSMLILFIGGISADDAVYPQFDIVLNKVGETDYYFSDFNHEVRNPRIIMTDQNQSAPYIYNFSFVWSIYTNSKISLIMNFYATEADASDGYGFMLRHTENNSIGINYDVKYNADSSDVATEIKGIEAVYSQAPAGQGVGMLLSNRQIPLLQNVQVTPLAGNSGHVDFTISIDPAKHAENGESFSAGQYTGYIEVQIMTGT